MHIQDKACSNACQAFVTKSTLNAIKRDAIKCTGSAYAHIWSLQGRHYPALAGATSVIYIWPNLVSRCHIFLKFCVPDMLA